MTKPIMTERGMNRISLRHPGDAEHDLQRTGKQDGREQIVESGDATRGAITNAMAPAAAEPSPATSDERDRHRHDARR